MRLIRAVVPAAAPEGKCLSGLSTPPCDTQADMQQAQGPVLEPVPEVEEGMAPALLSVSRRIPREFRFVDLFAGIGGLRLGLEAAGGRCVYSVEIDRYAQATYAANFGPIDESDVRAVDPAGLPPYDVLAAGFPCQPFSIAGVSKKASLGHEHGFADKTSGNLFFEITRIADATKPPILFLENVKNLRSHDKGRTFQVILGELDALGYEVVNDIVDAAHWVPQHRERTFMIGLRREVFGDRKFAFPPLPATQRPVLRDVLESWVDRKYVLTEHLWEYLQGYAKKHREAGHGFRLWPRRRQRCCANPERPLLQGRV